MYLLVDNYFDGDTTFAQKTDPQNDDIPSWYYEISGCLPGKFILTDADDCKETFHITRKSFFALRNSGMMIRVNPKTRDIIPDDHADIPRRNPTGGSRKGGRKGSL